MSKYVTALGPGWGKGPGGGGTQYKSGYRDVPQTWVAKSGCQVHQWVPFFSKMRYMDGCACFNRYIDGPFFIIGTSMDYTNKILIRIVHGTSMGRKFSINRYSDR